MEAMAGSLDPLPLSPTVSGAARADMFFLHGCDLHLRFWSLANSKQLMLIAPGSYL